MRELLEALPKDTIIGMAIQRQLDRNDLEACIYMLKGFIQDDPQSMRDYLGEELFNLVENHLS